MLAPTRFHRLLRDTLVANEPGLFAWYSSDKYETERIDQMRLELLRRGYRLSPESYERPHRLAREAAQKLGLDIPIVLYQLNQGEGANAGLCFARGEAHIVISGPLLTSLDDVELTALFGHELAHYLLFTLDNGTFLVTSELIEASAARGRSGAFVEAALRNRRWTEIFADRGAVIAAGSVEPAIACLVKVGTGLAQVSAQDYLVQAREVLARLDHKATEKGESHPENAVRAVALELWHTKGEAADDEIAAYVEGVVTLETLDIVQQRDLAKQTRELVDYLLAPAWMRTDATLAHARQFFPEYEWAEPPSESRRSSALDEYFAYILLDFAVVDRALGEVALARSLTVADELGCRDAFVTLARKDLKATAGSLAQLEQRSSSLFDRAQQQSETPA